MSRILLSTAIVIMTSTAVLSARGAALHIDDFQSGTTAGWGGSGIAPLPTLQSSGGPAGLGDAFLHIASTSSVGPGSRLATHNSALAWTGDYTAVAARRVTVDLRNPVTSQPLAMRLVLFGPLTTGERFTSMIAQQVPNDGVWRPYEFSLAEADLKRVLGNATYANLMDNALRIMLRHDADAPSSGGTPINATLGLDNIRLVERQPADFNDDGQVDADDLPIWDSGFAISAEGDADTDGDTDGADLLIWQRQFTDNPNPPFSVTVVPEPAAWWLLAWAMGWSSILVKTDRH